jgi:SPX domain protein involved in polyphosphate accumulation/uncharacterized membrane protein YidH (DUF202 family)
MVAFGDYLLSVEVKKYASKYIKYEELKTILEKAKKSRIGGTDGFYRLLDTSFADCKNFATDWLITLESSSQEWNASTISETLELNQFVYINQEALRKIIKKHDKNLPLQKLNSIWRWKMDFQMTQRIIDVLLNVIKLQPKQNEKPEYYSSSSLRTIAPPTGSPKKNDSKGNNDKTGMDASSNGFYIPLLDVEAPPVVENPMNNKNDNALQQGSFVRQSTKYWVHPCDLAAVCTVLGENLSAHSFDQGTPWTPVSSVYLDNSSRVCYGQRIVKNTNAKLMRLRVYNNDEKKVWLERKVHYEKWTGETSSKDRFCIENSQVMQVLRGQAVHTADKNVPLRNELQHMIRDLKLFPTCRIEYTRIAFQANTHDRVRISIDLNMRFLQERTSHMEWYTPEDRLATEDLILFPYSIVEIKLREEFITNPPEWLQDLQKSSLLHKENSFSKYVHATYAFSHLEGNPLKLRKPCWWDSMVFISPQMAIKPKVKLTEHELAVEDASNNQHWFMKMLGFTPDVGEGGKPSKVEPKTFFANERTFLSWFNSSLFISSIGVAIAADSSKILSGVLLVSVGIMLIFYAVFTYIQRTSSLLERKSAGYVDRYGPIVLALITILVLCSALFASSDKSSGL